MDKIIELLIINYIKSTPFKKDKCNIRLVSLKGVFFVRIHARMMLKLFFISIFWDIYFKMYSFLYIDASSSVSMWTNEALLSGQYPEPCPLYSA